MHGQQAPFADQLLAEVAGMARAERQVNTYSTLMGLFPVGVALLVAFAPLREQLASWVQGLELQPAADVGVLGATALVLTLGLARSIEDVVRTLPYCRTIERFLAGPSTDSLAGGRAGRRRAGADGAPVAGADAGRAAAGPRAVRLADIVIVLDRVSIVYPGSADRTPAAVSHRWGASVGLAVTGANGAGKTSLALALLGLIDPATGAIRFGHVPLAQVDWSALAGRICYQPQQAFVAPGASVAWHLRLLLGEGPTEAELEQALRAVGLYPALERHARAASSTPLDVPVGELSGGERRRMHLARALVGDPELVVLDEPEAGLDAAGRAELRTLVAELARHCRVLLIAHDPSIIPDGFRRLECVRRPVEAPG